MPVKSYGILLFRFAESGLQVLLVHPGGPFWKRKDQGAWSIPKGLPEEEEEPLESAKREFREETGFDVEGDLIDLGEFRQSARKTVHIWALHRDLDTAQITSGTFTLEWPPKSGILKEYPEIDEARWFTIEEAKGEILKGQSVFLDRLIQKIRQSMA